MVVIQRYYLDRSVAETAAVMGIPVGTVKSLAARALPLLRAGLGGEVVHGR